MASEQPFHCLSPPSPSFVISSHDSLPSLYKRFGGIGNHSFCLDSGLYEEWYLSWFVLSSPKSNFSDYICFVSTHVRLLELTFIYKYILLELPLAHVLTHI